MQRCESYIHPAAVYETCSYCACWRAYGDLVKLLIPFDMTMEASQAAASIAMLQQQSRMGELSEFQQGITVGMNII